MLTVPFINAEQFAEKMKSKAGEKKTNFHNMTFVPVPAGTWDFLFE